MIEQITFQTIFQFLQTVGILVGVFYYIMTIRSNQRSQKQAVETRQAQLFSQYYLRCTTPEFQIAESNLLELQFDTPQEFIDKYGPRSNSKVYEDFLQVFGLMEGLAVLVREDLINIRIVAHSSYGDVKYVWEKYEPVVRWLREHYNWPRYSIEYEHLYNLMEEYAEEHPELRT
jgi:hypothetical protein